MRRKMVLFAVGGTGYSMLEILYRGRTHWTMAVLGGLCLMLLASIVRRRPHWPLWKLSAAGAAAVTLAELAAGLLVNRILGWGVWDYSAQPLNLWGQICPRFSIYWLCLSYAACGVMRRFGGAERKSAGTSTPMPSRPAKPWKSAPAVVNRAERAAMPCRNSRCARENER